MKRIRKGKDIHIKWGIVVNDGDVALDSVALTVELKDDVGHVITLPHTITDNQYVECDYYGIDHRKLGRYVLTAWINKGKVGQSVLDKCDAFELVSCSHLEGGEDSNSLDTETVSLTSAISIGIQGASAYQSWLNQGNTGTEADFLASLKGDPGGVLYPSFDINASGNLIATIPETEADINVELKDNGHLILTI